MQPVSLNRRCDYISLVFTLMIPYGFLGNRDCIISNYSIYLSACLRFRWLILASLLLSIGVEIVVSFYFLLSLVPSPQSVITASVLVDTPELTLYQP